MNNELSYKIVKDGLLLKFSHKNLRQTLLDTGNLYIAEASPKDKIWGIGLKEADAQNMPRDLWPGQNILGKALMEIREEIKNIIYPLN